MNAKPFHSLNVLLFYIDYYILEVSAIFRTCIALLFKSIFIYKKCAFMNRYSNITSIYILSIYLFVFIFFYILSFLNIYFLYFISFLCLCITYLE